jgi:HK97 family phage portal protein
MRPLLRLIAKENPAWRPILAYYGMNQVQYTPKDYRILTEAGYQNVAAVYNCVAQISRGAAGIDWVVQKKQGDKWMNVPDHPLLVLLRRPNEFDGKSRFNEKVVAYKLLSGNSYVLRVGLGSQPPRFLYPLRPDRVQIKTGTPKNYISAYRYTVCGNFDDYSPEEVLHLTEFHPTDDFLGLSRLEVASKAIDISNWAMEWNLKLLQNDMRPPGAVVVDGTLTKQQREQMRTDLRQYQGAEHAGSIPIFEGGSDWRQLSLAPKDMDWLNSEKYNLRRICAIFNVDSCLVGDQEYATYSNKQEARKALYHEAILPEMDMMRDEYNNWLVPSFGDNIRLDYDRDAIEAIQEDRQKKFSYLAQADWMRINEKREDCGLEPLGEEGEVVLVPMGKVPLEMVAEGPEETEIEEEETTPEGTKRIRRYKAKLTTLRPAHKTTAPQAGKSFWTKAERKRTLWDNFVLRVKANEVPLRVAVKRFLGAQAARAAKAAAAAPGARILDLAYEAEQYAKATMPAYREIYRRAGEAGLRASKGSLFMPDEKAEIFQAYPDAEKRLYQMVVKSGTRLSETTMEKVLDIMSSGEGEGLTVDEMAGMIRASLGELEPWRTRLIARTEAAKVENWAQVEGYKQAEFVERKGWLCAFVEDSREAHIQADQTYRENTIPLDMPFEVDSELLQYPGDPAGSPGNICNCLCTTFPEVVEIEGGE